MISVSYKRNHCDKCSHNGVYHSSNVALWFDSHRVNRWVYDKLRASRYIWELGKGCKGCCQVYTNSAGVLGSLLEKLGIGLA